MFISGCEILDELSALQSSGKVGQIDCVGCDLMVSTSEGLLNGMLSMIISHSMQKLAEMTTLEMIKSRNTENSQSVQTTILPFEIFTRENV